MSATNLQFNSDWHIHALARYIKNIILMAKFRVASSPIFIVHFVAKISGKKCTKTEPCMMMLLQPSLQNSSILTCISQCWKIQKSLIFNPKRAQKLTASKSKQKNFFFSISETFLTEFSTIWKKSSRQRECSSDHRGRTTPTVFAWIIIIKWHLLRTSTNED